MTKQPQPGLEQGVQNSAVPIRAIIWFSYEHGETRREMGTPPPHVRVCVLLPASPAANDCLHLFYCT